MRAGEGVRAVMYNSHVIESSMFKNRDKQMTYIVRVSKSAVIFFVMQELSMGYNAFCFLSFSRIYLLKSFDRNFS